MRGTSPLPDPPRPDPTSHNTHLSPSQAVATAAVEAGVTTLLFRAADADLARAWEGLASFDAVVWGVDGSLVDAGSGRQAREGGRGKEGGEGGGRAKEDGEGGGRAK